MAAAFAEGIFKCVLSLAVARWRFAVVSSTRNTGFSVSSRQLPRIGDLDA
jgi:hypothetical protein